MVAGRYLLYAGMLACGVAVIERAAGGSGWVTGMGAVAGLAASLAGAIPLYRGPRPDAAPLFYDRLTGGGERFPALHELVVTGRRGPVRTELETECADRMRPVRFPFLAGPARFCLLPFLVAALVPLLPRAPQPAAGLPGLGAPSMAVTPPVGAGSSSPAVPGTAAIPGERPRAAATAGMAPPVAPGDVAGTAAPDDARAAALLETVARLGPGSAEGAGAAAELMRTLREGDTGLQRVMARIAAEAGSGGSGGGAGLTDPVLNALAAGDRERAAAAFAAFLERISAPGHAAELELVMRAAAEGRAPAGGPVRAGNGPAVEAWAAASSVSADAALPLRFQPLVQNYLEARARQADPGSFPRKDR